MNENPDVIRKIIFQLLVYRKERRVRIKPINARSKLFQTEFHVLIKPIRDLL